MTPTKFVTFLITLSETTIFHLHVGCDEAQWTAYFTTAGKKQGTCTPHTYLVALCHMWSDSK